MINRSSCLNHKPFLLKPAAKDYLWGGNRLNEDFPKHIDLSPLAETWECSTHLDGPSSVASGEFIGMTLPEVLKAHPEFLGTHHRERGELPILVKLIDAKRDLSVQVHPDDTYAAEYENGQLGKTEMWYVLDATKGAHVIYGLQHSVEKHTLRGAIGEGTIEKYLQKIPIRKNDVFYIRPGTIHAIGAGALIAEIQQNSNLTYRLYDYDRVDKDGKKRPLHIDRAMEVADLNAEPEPRQPLRVLRFACGCATELLCRCKYFQVERVRIRTERHREMADLRVDGLSFQVLLCVDGCGTIFCEREPLPFFKGDCVFVPADSEPLRIHGSAQLLKVRC